MIYVGVNPRSYGGASLRSPGAASRGATYQFRLFHDTWQQHSHPGYNNDTVTNIRMPFHAVDWCKVEYGMDASMHCSVLRWTCALGVIDRTAEANSKNWIIGVAGAPSTYAHAMLLNSAPSDPYGYYQKYPDYRGQEGGPCYGGILCPIFGGFALTPPPFSWVLAAGLWNIKVTGNGHCGTLDWNPYNVDRRTLLNIVADPWHCFNATAQFRLISQPLWTLVFNGGTNDHTQYAWYATCEATRVGYIDTSSVASQLSTGGSPSSTD